ncbi:hypothetical protein JHS3_13700 [Jeongeupia sp. HS-3]|uniref:hypothetical protein n=1 Tax=Jeongeupia sp. HS-3 TaxID=1009682 RepID=UPI0018A5D080|nr:hypothetical protein [Jeongeupia sp. HS-3]BCL75634.1 hypothetical protein JHS3_13700 [Jeongeupia sp. HS-3]
MVLIPEEILLSAARMAMLDGLSPAQTMAVVFRAIDHEFAGAGGRRFNPARTAGVGAAIYAAMFGYPLRFVIDPAARGGHRWESEIPAHGYSQPFQSLFIEAMLLVDTHRRRRQTAPG